MPSRATASRSMRSSWNSREPLRRAPLVNEARGKPSEPCYQDGRGRTGTEPQRGGPMWKSSLIAIIALAISVASAHAWSEQNCMSMCRLTAPSGKAEACIARTHCAKYHGKTHETDERVQRAAGRWKERNYLAGSMYQGKMSGGRTFRHRRGICGARQHSSGYC